MRITAIEEYGLRCLLQLARRGPGAKLSISEIAELEGISVSYASKLLAILRKAELVAAERGRGGGFSVTRPASQINLYEVLVALGGPLIDPDHCQKYTGQLEACVHVDGCTVYTVFGGLATYVKQFLTDTTLDELTTHSNPALLSQKASMDVVNLSRQGISGKDGELSQKHNLSGKREKSETNRIPNV